MMGSRSNAAYSPDYFRLYPRPTYLLLYKEPQNSYKRILNLRPQKAERRGLSRNSAMKMRRALSWLISAADIKHVYEKKYKKKVPWRVNMITLTVPVQNGLDDRMMKRLMNTFFKFAYYHGLKNYVWRAELQKRGVIHFHIISDWYIHYTNLRHAWNRILRRANLLGSHENPNSTDVHAVLDSKVKNLFAYVIDYMQKKTSDGEREIKGRLWGCSKSLSKAGKNYLFLDEGEAEIVHNALKDANWNIKQIDRTACFMYTAVNQKNPYKLIADDDDIKHIFNNELQAIKSNNIQLALFERQSILNTT